MGYNTSMIIMNDALDQIKKDPEFGKNVAEAVSKLSLGRPYIPEYGVDVRAGMHVNAATVIESHHADATSVVAFGGNRGLVLSKGLYAYGTEDEEVRILRELADRLGYHIRKKPQRGPVMPEYSDEN